MADLLTIHISGKTIEHLAVVADNGLDFLRALDADWSYLREQGVEEIMRVEPTGDILVRHHRRKVPWLYRSIADPPPLPEVHPAVLAYVTRSTCA